MRGTKQGQTKTLTRVKSLAPLTSSMMFRSRHVSFPSNYFSPDLHIFGFPGHFHFLFKEKQLTLSPRIPTAPRHFRAHVKYCGGKRTENCVNWCWRRCLIESKLRSNLFYPTMSNAPNKCNTLNWTTKSSMMLNQKVEYIWILEPVSRKSRNFSGAFRVT